MILFDIAVTHYFLSGISAFVLFFAVYNKQIKIIRKIFSKYDKVPAVIFIDSILISILGAIICTVVMQPATYQQSIINGLGWSGLVNGFGTPHRK